MVVTGVVVVEGGGVIADGFDPELDRLRDIGTNSQQWLARYQKQLIDESSISSLRVGFNKVFGYYIEVTDTHRAKVPQAWTRKQTVKNAERYITDELKKFEDLVLSARDRSLAREKQLYDALLDRLNAQLRPLQAAAQSLAELDVLACFSERSRALNFCRPQLVDEACIEIRAGRHPVVEQTLDAPFVPNDLALSDALRADIAAALAA